MVGILRSRFRAEFRNSISFSIDLITDEKRPKADFRRGVLSVPLARRIFPTYSLVISLVCLEAQRRRDKLIRILSTPTVISTISL
ncbi:MAG: hypothetical protein A4E43_01443 [Methanosaeta sp. PtaB.Bin005]|nr:MAG: hypothetical protein A4E43_01443 [Methanosaeta sp. PtaB.Bin005]